MRIAELIIAAISTIAASVAAVAALSGLRYARASAEEGRKAALAGLQSAEAAQTTVQLADEVRRDADHDRERHHLVHIGELVERLFWVASLESNNVDHQFRATMNLLTQALVGRDESLPCCALLLQAANADYVKGLASPAREEIKLRLRALESQWQAGRQ